MEEQGAIECLSFLWGFQVFFLSSLFHIFVIFGIYLSNTRTHLMDTPQDFLKEQLHSLRLGRYWLVDSAIETIEKDCFFSFFPYFNTQDMKQVLLRSLNRKLFNAAINVSTISIFLQKKSKTVSIKETYRSSTGCQQTLL